MAERANSTAAPAVHELSGSTPPGAGRPVFRPTSPSRPAPKPRPQVRPRIESHPGAAHDVSPDPDDCDVSERIATIAEFADMEIEPWPKSEGEPHTDAEWAELANPNLIMSRIAWRLCQMSKPDLMQMVRGLPSDGDGSAGAMADRLIETEDFFKGYMTLVSTGWTRLAIACAALAREQGMLEGHPGHTPEAATPKTEAA